MNAALWNAFIVEWLAGLFLAPLSLETVQAYRDGLGTMLVDALAEDPGAALGAGRMQLALMAETSAMAVQRSLAAGFTQLFEGVAGPNTVSLYESAHTGISGRLFQKPVSDMYRLLRLLDVSLSEVFREPPDHLSVELALLGNLIRRTSGHGAQVALLDDHLLTWIPKFSRECGDADRTGFYAGAAMVLSEFLSLRRIELRGAGGPAEPLSSGAGTGLRLAINRTVRVAPCRSE